MTATPDRVRECCAANTSLGSANTTTEENSHVSSTPRLP